ncbi:MAG: RNA 3'-terminal phosphate cyclase, partial [Candidatus Aenigmarchaeota archaeon]|nr:RNA 3'-terminal phosphate cyclase [Candidatus Aenigmarchaeota archaeon]
MITIDGAYGEGGGQIVRTAVALSAVTKKPIKITNIRAKRCVSGLSHQHIASIKAIATLFNAKTKGVVVGSNEIEFIPGSQIKTPITIEIPTAGSVSLVLQTLLIAGIHTTRTIHATINGGATFGKWAPPITYTEEVLGHILKEVGYDFKLDIFKHGFYPKGGAKVMVWIKPKRIKPFNIKKRGEMKFYGFSVASKDLK